MMRTMLGKGPVKLRLSGESLSDGDSDASSQPLEATETYVEWIQRVTHEVEDKMTAAQVPDWVEECHLRKWRWYGHTCRRNDNRWSRRVLFWTPERGSRCQGHPFSRWTAEFELFAGKLDEAGIDSNLQTIAQDRASWGQLEKDFVNMCHDRRT
jgi:hypothetical protein